MCGSGGGGDGGSFDGRYKSGGTNLQVGKCKRVWVSDNTVVRSIPGLIRWCYHHVPPPRLRTGQSKKKCAMHQSITLVKKKKNAVYHEKSDNASRTVNHYSGDSIAKDLLAR